MKADYEETKISSFNDIEFSRIIYAEIHTVLGGGGEEAVLRNIP